MNLFNREYDVYSHSYLCYGGDQFRLTYLGDLVNKANGSSIIEDPCLQFGYNQNLTYDNIFSTACNQNQSVPPSVNASSTFLIKYKYLFVIMYKI